MKPKIRIISFWLAICLVVGLLPIPAFAVGTDTGKAIQLVDSGTAANISGGQADSVYFGTYQQSSDGSGGYNTDPIKWRVLENAGSKLFLLSDQNLDVFEYHKISESVTWETSTMRSWLNGADNNFLGKAFSAKEQTAIADTEVVNDDNPEYQTEGGNNTTDKIFLLSDAEARNKAYFADRDSRIATNTAYVAGRISAFWGGSPWWLRSPGESAFNAAFVYEDGFVSRGGSYVIIANRAVRPAFNLDLNSVLFTSAANGGKPDGGLTEVPEYTGNEWKLTLLDKSRSFTASTNSSTNQTEGYTGWTVDIQYTGAGTGNNEYVSAMLADSSGEILYYGRLAQNSANGTANVTIPSGLAAGSYTLKVFSEQYNGDYKTDYASKFTDIALTVEKRVDEQFSLTPGGRYYFDLSAMDIPGTKNDKLPDGSFHWVPFTYVGTINAYSRNSEGVSTDGAVSPYNHSLFIADYNVTRSVSWDELNNKSLIFGKDYQSGGVSYTLRAPSVGSTSTGSGNSERGTPQSNEWDKILDKDSGYIKNWSGMYSWGQDTYKKTASTRAVRGYDSARTWNLTYATYSNPSGGFRPVLEILNADTLNSDGLKVVTLDLGDGKLGGSSDAIQIIVKNSSTFTAPVSDGLTRPDGDTGSYFMWLDGNGNSYEPGGSVPADVTELTVQWTAPTYTVTLNTNGGTIADGKDVTSYTYGVDTKLPTADDMTYTGHTFKGWYADSSFSGEPVTAIGDTETGNKEYWAKWTINQYTITFDTAGGSDIAPITQDYGSNITAPANPTREGYTFLGWDKAIPATMPAENMTIKAKWKVNSYTITFDTAGGSEIAPITQDYGTAIVAPADPAREGYTFLGWDKAIPTTMPAENMTITAKWKVNSYTITFDTAGGSTVAPITQDYGMQIAAPANPTREGYTFLGWDKAIPATMPAENMTIKAKWKVNSYTITFDTAGGSTVAPITQDYGTAIVAPADPAREGYTFMGWDKAIPATMPAENVTVTAKWKVNSYTITFNTAGGSEIAPITQNYGTAITAPESPTREGYTFMGWDKAIPTTMPAESMTIKAKWKDSEKPTGEIIIGTNKWSEFLNELTYGLFFKDTQTVTINASDNSGIVFVSYLVTDQDLSEAELKSLVYRAYDEPFLIEPNGEYIVYVMLVDASLNITYLRSDRITLDNIQPVISGIEDGKTYCEAQTVTINEKYTDTVTVNGTAVTLDENGSFVLSPANGKQKIVVTDKAGNTAEMTVTVNDGHTLLADDNDCTTPVYCKFCNEEVIAAKSHRFTGNWQNDETAHWHICQNENCTVTDRKTAHSGEDDGNCLTAVVCECGYVITAAKPAHTFNEWTSNGNGTHTRKCTVVGCNGIETEDCSGGKATCTEQAVCTVCHTGYGDALGHNFTIAQHDETHHWNKCSRCDATDTKAEHTGGTATCREKAVCEVCNSAYGKLGAANHVGGTEIRDAKPQSCIENGYTGDTYCKGCGEKLSSGTVIHADGHKGGTATCTDKAECEVCHEKYGEPDANHHTGLETVEAVPATAASTGTAAHWRCTACGKLFADADGKQEIRSEDTVTKKLAPSILDGANSEWRKGDENGLTFSSDAAFSDFVEVLVDGKPVASENYERHEGGTIVELKASYLETLAEGEHTLTIRSASGDATTRFTIAASNSTNAWVWIIIGFIALGIGVTVAVFVIRKRKTA